MFISKLIHHIFTKIRFFLAKKSVEVLFTHYSTILNEISKKYLFQNYSVSLYLTFTGISKTKFTCQVCMCYSRSHFRRWCNYVSRDYPLSKILCSINGCQRQYSVLHSHIRQIKQQHFRFWDTHWNI